MIPQSLRALVLCILISLIFLGCATFKPLPLDEASLRQRAVTQSEKGVSVSAAVLSAEEAEKMFGRPLYKKGIQPIWLEIENQAHTRLWLPPVSIDRDYFAPLEAAYLFHSSFGKTTNDRIDKYFHRHNLQKIIDPDQIRSGFVFTNLEMGTKAFNVDVIGNDNQIRTFTFLIPVEGLKVDYREVDWTALYADKDRVEYNNLDALRKTLEALPCCTTGADFAKPADPINVVIIGNGKDVL